MSVFSITALDRLIESDRRSSGSAETTPRMEKQRERRPLYVSYPYSSSTSTTNTSSTTSSTTGAATTILRPHSPSSPSSFSPSPYVVNHKRRVPNGVGASQQNGFNFSEKSRPSESQRELLSVRSSSEEEKNQKKSLELSSKGPEQGRQGPSLVIKEHSRSPQSSLTLHFQAEAAAASRNNNSSSNDNNGRKAGDGVNDSVHKDGNRWKNDSHSSGRMGAVEEKAKGKRIGGFWERREMNSRNDDPRGKMKLEEGTYGEGSTSVQEGNASSSDKKPADKTDARTPSGSSSEEWFDAADGPLPEYSSDDDMRRHSMGDPGPSSRGDPDSNIVLQLKAEIQRRVAAEEAREALELQRDGMTALLSSAGISLLPSDEGDIKIAEHDNVVGVTDSEAQRLMVTRYVAGAVATGAVRAEAEAELQTVLAEKSKEIARLKDKLQYYELLNHEMSQRNQESIENARQARRRRQRRQRMVVFGLSAAICVGVSAAVIYHYGPWEQVKGLNDVSTALEGEQPNPKSLDKVVEFREPNPEN